MLLAGQSSLGWSLCVQGSLSVSALDSVCARASVCVSVRVCMFKACQQLSMPSVISSGAYTLRAWA